MCRFNRTKGIIFCLLLMAASTVVFTYCAKIAAPTGGPKDETPPKIVKSIPVSGITSFKGKEIEITFDEYVALDKLNEKLMISPPVAEKPDIYLRGKSLFIKFKEQLKDSTTYTLYFGDAIKDLNEGNPIDNFQFVFATGKVIDSLSVTGNVLLAENLEPGKDILVMLHRELADSAPRKRLPDYITLADVNGGFRINNIREGKYRMYALVDKNNNKRYDLADESFAFLDSVIDINHIKNYIPAPADTVKEVKPVVKPEVKPIRPGEKIKKEIPLINGEHKLYLFTPARTVRYLTSSPRKQAYQLVYTLSLPPDSMDFTFDIPGTGNRNWFIENSIARDTMTVWLRDSSLYNKPLIRTVITYPYTDSTGKVITRRDSIQMRFAAPRVTRGRQVRTPLKYSTNIGAFASPKQKVSIISTTPLLLPDTSKIKVFYSEQKSLKPLPFSILKDSANSRKLLFDFPLISERKYLISLDRGALRNIYGEYSDSSGISFTVRTPDSYGTLILKITNVPCNLIIQLLDNKEKFVAEKVVSKAGNIEFPMLDRGTYRLRAIYDLNGDGRWTTGDYDKKIQPEPVSYLPKEVEVKVNWEVTEEWDTGKFNYKDQKLKVKSEQSGL